MSDPTRLVETLRDIAEDAEWGNATMLAAADRIEELEDQLSDLRVEAAGFSRYDDALHHKATELEADLAVVLKWLRRNTDHAGWVAGRQSMRMAESSGGERAAVFGFIDDEAETLRRLLG